MRDKVLFLTVAALFAFKTVNGQALDRRATFVRASDPSQGRCTVSVVVDGAADVEIRGDHAVLRNVTGRTPYWQQFECTGPMPVSPVDLRIHAVEGNGRMTLTHDSSSGGLAIVRVNNLEGGDQPYTFDVTWSPSRSSVYRYSDTEADRSVLEGDAIQSCRTAVENRLRNDGYRYIRFGSSMLDDRGASDMVNGTASANRGYDSDAFSFSCRVNLRDGQVRRLDVNRR